MKNTELSWRWLGILGLGVALALTGCATQQQDQAQAGAPAFVTASSTIAAPGVHDDTTGFTYQTLGNASGVPAFHQSGQASYYAARFQGRRTASGERYDGHALTAAHRTLPLGSYVRVTDVATSKSVIVKINDRGPFGRRNRIIDLSYAAASALGIQRAGVANVRIKELSREEAQVARASMLASR